MQDHKIWKLIEKVLDRPVKNGCGHSDHGILKLLYVKTELVSLIIFDYIDCPILRFRLLSGGGALRLYWLKSHNKGDIRYTLL